MTGIQEVPAGGIHLFWTKATLSGSCIGLARPRQSNLQSINPIKFEFLHLMNSAILVRYDDDRRLGAFSQIHA